MRISPKYRYACILLAAVLAAAPAILRAPSVAAQTNERSGVPEDLSAAMTQYRQALAAYDRAHDAYAAAASAYWHEISAKRQLRNAERAHGEPFRSPTTCSISRRSIPGRRSRAIR